MSAHAHCYVVRWHGAAAAVYVPVHCSLLWRLSAAPTSLAPGWTSSPSSAAFHSLAIFWGWLPIFRFMIFDLFWIVKLLLCDCASTPELVAHWFASPLLDKLPLGGLTWCFLFSGLLVFGYFFWKGREPVNTVDDFSLTASRSQLRGSRYTGILIALFFLNIMYQFPGSCAIWSEGCVGTMTDTRVDFNGFLQKKATKTHGMEPQKIEKSMTSTNSHVKKRSFRRALLRASKHGYTWYKGRLCSAKQLGVTMTPISIQHSTPNVDPPPHRKRRRLACLSWNCSGLSPSDWDMFQIWLDSQALDVILLQESHWGYTSEWLQTKYYAIHSGFKSGQAGLLCLVSRQICKQADLSWQEVEPGRILHVRIHHEKRSVDVVNLYQHVYKPGNLDLRSEIWSKLSYLLSTFSKKHALILAGDANCSTDQRCTAIGLPSYERHGERHRGTSHSDSHLWIQLLKQHNLIALNTWSPNNTATYEFNHQHSRIDYIICRREHGDPLAKDVQMLHDFALLPLTGAFHVPLLTTLRKDWFLTIETPTARWTRQQRLQLHQHCVKQDETYEQFQHQMNTLVNNLQDNTTPDLDTLHSQLMTFSGQVFNVAKPTPLYRCSVGPYRRFQEHTRQLRQLQGTDLASLFAAWRQVHLRGKARKDMTQSSRATRKQKLMQVFTTAQRADQARDHFALYQAIRDLAPKQTSRRIMLRDAQGHLMGPQESADWIHDWYKAIYSAAPCDPIDTSAHWPFDVQSFSDALNSIPTHKALDPSFAPAPMWKYGAEGIATYLDPVLHDFCEQFRFPKCWGSGTLALLVKPGKRGQHPSELRPIALLEPTSKVAMGLIATALQTTMRQVLCRLPLFAYLGGRGTEDAIHRVVLHCTAVRARMKSFDYPIHRMIAGEQPSALEGGLSFCLDLTRAFDTVDRPKLFDGLTRLGIDPNLVLLLQGIYAQTTYSFEHRGVSKCFLTHKGIRQGCKAAPCLWSAYAAVLLLQTAEHINWQFVTHFITTFADDFCIHQLFTSVVEFEALLSALGVILDLIEQAGLELNVAKTTATLRMRGKLLNQIQRRHLHRTKHGVFLKIPRHDGTFTHIQLVRSFRYLGVMLSYHNFERETMALRIKHSAQTAQQLQKWLYATKSLSLKGKVRLWYQCVFSCLKYGLLFTGFNDCSLHMLYRFAMRQLRRIYKEPVFLTRETHQDFFVSTQFARSVDAPAWSLLANSWSFSQALGTACTWWYSSY